MMEGVCRGAGESPLPQEPIPAPPMFSGESPGVGDTTSEEESLYGGLLERLRGDQEEETWPAGLPRSQSYTEGSLQEAAAPSLIHAQSHHALLQDLTPPPEKPDSHSCLHILHTVVACQQEQIGVLQATLRDLAATYTRRERALVAKLSLLQQEARNRDASLQRNQGEDATGDDTAKDKVIHQGKRRWRSHTHAGTTELSQVLLLPRYFSCHADVSDPFHFLKTASCRCGPKGSSPVGITSVRKFLKNKARTWEGKKGGDNTLGTGGWVVHVPRLRQLCSRWFEASSPQLDHQGTLMSTPAAVDAAVT
ncbi:uncharacterized protein [Panulirus ornatus]|uniref:uncharacterized protein n=1 Tax=Panulirus ornatus TaxID=150431 RepID=UPI003A879EC7